MCCSGVRTRCTSYSMVDWAIRVCQSMDSSGPAKPADMHEHVMVFSPLRRYARNACRDTTCGFSEGNAQATRFNGDADVHREKI